jgi:hypothetical protein
MEEPRDESQREIGEAEREADQELGELEDAGDEMEERLTAVADETGDVAVPYPAEAAGPGVDESDIPEDEGESAHEAGQ